VARIILAIAIETIADVSTRPCGKVTVQEIIA
jgi:hypothetical protein